MIQAQDLPPRRSVFDYPLTVPGVPLTEEQEEQVSLAQIAAIVLAVAAAKNALTNVTTNQIVALLRVTDLTSTAAVALFAKQAAALVRLAIGQSKQVTWAGVASRTGVMGVEFPMVLPPDEQIDPDLRYSRGTDLETAYKRLAEEYLAYKSKTKDDPQIVELVKQFEDQGLTPLPRPDNISNDAVQRVVNGKEAWREEFAKAEAQALKDEGRKIPIFETDEEETAPGRREARARAEAEKALRAETVESTVSDAGDKKSSGSQQSGKSSSGTEDQGDSGSDEVEPLLTLTDPEIMEVIERYAEQKVEERAERMVSHDVQASSRNTHQLAMRQLSDKKVTGFRRVIHPELSESGQSCGLCIVASTMRYTRRDLLPIHAGCNCETVEIFDIDGVEFDPGHQINLEDLEVFYREAGDSTHGWDLKRGRYKVIDHPEYGPTLTNVSDKKRTENVPYAGKV